MPKIRIDEKKTAAMGKGSKADQHPGVHIAE